MSRNNGKSSTDDLDLPVSWTERDRQALRTAHEESLLAFGRYLEDMTRIRETFAEVCSDPKTARDAIQALQTGIFLGVAADAPHRFPGELQNLFNASFASTRRAATEKVHLV